MKHVLLVEDDPDVRALLTEILDEAGFGVTDVRTFADARHAVRHGRQLARDFKAALLAAGATDKTGKSVARQATLDSRAS